MQSSISFILPALNEAVHIENSINSIRKFTSCLDDYEIIVVDNGSTDCTTQIAHSCGAKVYSKPGLTVGALRNFGASVAKHEYLVFIDADVCLTARWEASILKILDRLKGNTYTIAGSTCGIGANPSCIESCWWGHKKATMKVNYINSGHMIVRLQVFQELGGFDERLKTGEDAEFCQRERQIEVEIYHDPSLRVIHNGYPKTWYEFFKRERWHGLGDYSSISLFIRSKPAVLATTQATSLLIAVLFCLVSGKFYWLILYPSYIVPISLLAAYKRVPSTDSCLIVNTALYFVYFWARTFALVDFIINRKYMRNR